MSLKNNNDEEHALLLQGFTDTVNRIRTNPLIEKGYIDIIPERYFYLFRCLLIDIRPIIFPTKQDAIYWKEIVKVCEIYGENSDELAFAKKIIGEQVNTNIRFFNNPYLQSDNVEDFFATYINGDGHHYNPDKAKIIYQEKPLARENSQKDIMLWSTHVAGALTYLTEWIANSEKCPKLKNFLPHFDNLESY